MHTIIPIKITDQQVGKSVYQVLKEADLSSTLIRQLKREAMIHLNHYPVKVDVLLKTDDLLELVLPIEDSEGIVPEKLDLDILYEDEDLLIINKAAGIPVHPTFNYYTGTLANGVVHYWKLKDEKHRFRAINRLDKDTTGIVLIAKNLFAYNRIAVQQERNSLQKMYLAFVQGNPLVNQEEIHQPIGRKDGSIIEREVRFDGQLAITQYRVIQRYDEFSLLELVLLTGRTHQIRVHMSYIGHPLLGDDLYGGKRALIARHALHASSITFMHPRTNQEINILAPLPNDMAELL